MKNMDIFCPHEGKSSNLYGYKLGSSTSLEYTVIYPIHFLQSLLIKEYFRIETIKHYKLILTTLLLPYNYFPRQSRKIKSQTLPHYCQSSTITVEYPT